MPHRSICVFLRDCVEQKRGETRHVSESSGFSQENHRAHRYIVQSFIVGDEEDQTRERRNIWKSNA